MTKEEIRKLQYHEIDQLTIKYMDQFIGGDMEYQLVRTRLIMGDEGYSKTIKLHTMEITKVILFSMGVKGLVDHMKKPIFCLQGFVDTVGRMPIKGDEIRLLFGGRKYKINYREDYIESEVAYQIIKLGEVR